MPKRYAPSQSTFRIHGRWTQTEAEQVIAAFEQSGLPVRAFATREGLDPQRLTRWRRRLSEVAEPSMFEEITPRVTRAGVGSGEAAPVRQEPFEVVLRSGRVVRVPESFNASALLRLLAVAEEEEPTC